MLPVLFDPILGAQPASYRTYSEQAVFVNYIVKIPDFVLHENDCKSRDAGVLVFDAFSSAAWSNIGVHAFRKLPLTLDIHLNKLSSHIGELTSTCHSV